MQGIIPKLHEHPGRVWRTGPPLGQDNDLVLKEWLGLSESEVAQLQKDGLV
jgi:formyl-CoA transferase